MNYVCLQNKDFSDGGSGLDPIQIKPQRIRIRLVPSKLAFRNPACGIYIRFVILR